MTELRRVRATWTGFRGGPGVSTFYFLDTATAVDSLHSFFASVNATMPSTVNIQVENAGDIIEDTTGNLTGAWSSTPVTSISSGLTGLYAAPLGCMVSWETTTILDRARVKGRTFLVPTLGGAFEADGSVNAATLAVIKSAGDALVFEQSASMVVWHRPFAGSPAAAGRPARAAHLGGHALVTTCRVPDMAAVLRSRRD